MKFAKKVLLYQSGLYLILGLFSITVALFAVSGDSTTPKENAITPLLTPPSTEIR
tara:strand:- start:594 stop:758 length:165 start_codon:yes stop_codon:yes gene_type:complete